MRRRILVEVERAGNACTHVKYAEQLGAHIADITGEADVFNAHTKIFKTQDGLCYVHVVIVSTYLKTLEQERAVVELVIYKRIEFKLVEIRFHIVDEA